MSKYIPADCGTVAYGTPQTTRDLYAEGNAPAITDGKLTYTVKQADSHGATGTITVNVTTENYENFTITVNVNLTNKTPVTLSGVICGNRTYNGTAYAYTGTPVWKTEEGGIATGETNVTYYKTGESKAVAAPTDAGSYQAVFTIESENYVGSESYGFEITKAVITVAAKNKNIYVGDTVPSLEKPAAGTDYTVTGLCGTDTLGGTAAMSYAQKPDNTKTGTYAIEISGLTAPEGDNYTITFTNGTLMITTKPSGGGGSSSGGSTGGDSSSGGSTGEVTTGKDSGSNVTTTISPTEVKVENGTASATVKAENVTEAITTFGGNTLKIRLEIPAALAGKDVAVIHIAEDGRTEKMPGKTVTEGRKQYYEFTTPHLSTFALVDSSVIKEETPAVTATKKGTLLTDSKTKMIYKVTKSGTTGITIPSKVTKIGNYAFKGCTKLKTINLNTTLLTTKTVSEYAFSGVSASAVVKVPKSRNKTYKKLLVRKGLSKKVTVKGL